MKTNDENVPPSDFHSSAVPLSKKVRNEATVLQEIPSLPFALGINRARADLKHGRSSNSRKTTATSDSTMDTTNCETSPMPKLLEDAPKKERPLKDNRGKISSTGNSLTKDQEIELIERSQKAMKVNNSSKPKFASYLALRDEKKKTTEYFRLYKDQEIGFSKKLQKYIRDSVSFWYNNSKIQKNDDDCQTDDDQIEAAQDNLRNFLKEAAKYKGIIINAKKYQSKGGYRCEDTRKLLQRKKNLQIVSILPTSANIDL
eukprot:TRINITY_DN138185_c0_g1_i1.p2 TRINITY_DN138185_c0_g1~~TRINITY_DN138185_c0_g1_i1.p2  ORF type:complete len:258 (-),score=22.72 TRINITY_DN138185_c0_g1_i1:57-830(-)